MLALFTELEKKKLYGHARSIAEKHSVSKQYVNFIVSNKRNISTTLAKNIYNDLKSILEILIPKNNTNV